MHTQHKTFDCYLAKRWIQQIGLYPRSSQVPCSVYLSIEVAVVYQQICDKRRKNGCNPLGLAVFPGTEPETDSNWTPGVTARAKDARSGTLARNR
jgi:hypothetical protein